MSKLFTVGFPKDFEEIKLLELFSIHGTVNTVTIIRDKATGLSKGYAFITMNDDAGAERAISALDGLEIGDRKLSVRFAKDKGRPSSNENRPAQRVSFITANNRKNVQSDTPRPRRPRRTL